MKFSLRTCEGVAPAREVFVGCRRRPGASAGTSETNRPVLMLADHACRWPIGDPRAPGFRFCSARRLPGAPYCARHEEKAKGDDLLPVDLLGD